jgi:hypothetical protein
MVSVHELLNPTVQLGEVSIGVELTEQWVELTMHQPPVEIVTAASDAVVDAAIPEVGWFLPLQRSRQLSTSRIAAFSVLPASYRSNAEVIQLLASANATNHRLGKASVLDDLTDELFQVDETWDDEVVPVEDGLHPSWIAHLRPVLQSGPSRR